MGNETEFETRNGRKWETRLYKIHHFSTKNLKNRGKKTGKQGGKQYKKTVEKKQEKNRKLQEIQKRGFDEVLGNAENGKEFLARFREMLKTETRSSRMSRNDDSRAKTMYCPTPTPTVFQENCNL